MRATEFIVEANKEGKVNKHHADVQRGVTKMRDKGGYDRIYHMNRIGMALAKADGKSKKAVKDMDSASWIEKYNTAHPYTEEEHKMFQSAFNTVPTDHKEVLPWSKSQEPDDTHRVSPTANWNPNNDKKKKK